MDKEKKYINDLLIKLKHHAFACIKNEYCQRHFLTSLEEIKIYILDLEERVEKCQKASNIKYDEDDDFIYIKELNFKGE